MSELQRSFAKSKLAKLPPEAPIFDSMNSLDESRDEDGSSASSPSSTGTLVPSPTRHLFARKSEGFVLQAHPRFENPDAFVELTQPQAVIVIVSVDRILRTRALPFRRARQHPHYSPCLRDTTNRGWTALCHASRCRFIRSFIRNMRR